MILTPQSHGSDGALDRMLTILSLLLSAVLPNLQDTASLHLELVALSL